MEPFVLYCIARFITLLLLCFKMFAFRFSYVKRIMLIEFYFQLVFNNLPDLPKHITYPVSLNI